VLELIYVVIKRLDLRLNAYPVIPHQLRATPTANVARKTIDVDTAALFHHHYLDSQGRRPPNPDPTNFQHLSLFLPQQELRACGGGLGSHKAYRISSANQLGQAFCRLFLSKYLNIHYFMHMDDALRGPLIPAFSGCHFEKVPGDDGPDYFCAEDVNRIYLAEAKGRRHGFSFASKVFSNWRKQFDHVVFYDPEGLSRKLKGHIVATRFVAQTDSPALRSTVYAEDPESPGEVLVDEENGVGGAVMQSHYAGIVEKLDQQILSAALGRAFAVPDEIRFPGFIWELRLGPLQGKQFVGGYFSHDGTEVEFMKEGDALVTSRHPLRLDQAGGTFFGLEVDIFRTLAQVARSGAHSIAVLRPLPKIEPFYSGVSLLRDGSILGPLEFFRTVGQESF